MEDNRVTIREAAILLDISEGAVRKRVDRGTLRHDKGTDGRVYVYLPAGEDAGNPPESNALISEMRSRIDFLEEELRRKDAILMNMTEAMKALSPPPDSSPEPRESPETVSEPSGSGDHPPETEQRSWWRRMFGG